MLGFVQCQRLVLVATLLAAGATARATLVAYDGFEDYTPNATINGANGGNGWAAAWYSEATVRITNAALAYAQGDVVVAGGSQALAILPSGAQIKDNHANRPLPATSATVYFSLLFQASPGTGLTDDDFIQCILNDDADQNNAGSLGMRNATGASAGNDGFFARIRNNTADFGSNTLIKAAAGQTYFLVGQYAISGAHGSNYDTMRLWVNPLTLTEPLLAHATVAIDAVTGQVNYLTFRTAFMEAGDYFLVDELRIGTTYASVVPEPASIVLFALGGLGLCRAFRRRATPT